MQIEPAVMSWLRESSGWTKLQVSKLLKIQLEGYLKIEKGERQPTYGQLEILSRKFNRPFAAFLLPAPRLDPDLPEDFRLGMSDEVRPLSVRMRRVIRRARWLQSSTLELLRNLNVRAAPSIAHHTLSHAAERVATEERLKSGIHLAEQEEWKNSYDAFRKWRIYLESKNVHVFQLNMPAAEARGFSLTDKNPFVLAVNSADDINARIFTMFHEYAHALLSREVQNSSLCVPESLELTNQRISRKARVERWCNIFAARFILPEKTKSMLATLWEERPDYDTLSRSSRRLKVSKYALLIRMREFGIVDESIVSSYVVPRYVEGSITPKRKSKRTGGRGQTRVERTKYEKGESYVSLVLENLQKRHITTLDALDLLSVRTDSLEKLEAQER